MIGSLQLTLISPNGERKYLTHEEGRRFIGKAGEADAKTSALCWVLAYSGCRLSEALALTQSNIDVEQGCINFRTLKRRRTVWRAVPVPEKLIWHLLALPVGADGGLFDWSRVTGWRKVKRVMRFANIRGNFATPKGLRHRYGVLATQRGIAPTLIQRWMGHAKLENTAIYQQAVGFEERKIAEKLWN